MRATEFITERRRRKRRGKPVVYGGWLGWPGEGSEGDGGGMAESQGDFIQFTDRSILEAPLSDYVPQRLDQKAPRWPEPDRKLVTHPRTLEKATKFFEQTPYDFRLFFSGRPGLRQHKESGEWSVEKIQSVFGTDADQIIQGHEGAITVVFTGNFGTQRVLMTPWVMAHRIGHVIQVSNRGWAPRERLDSWERAGNYFFAGINSILDNLYGIRRATDFQNRYGNVNYNIRPEYNALFNAIGTQRSSRENLINRPYEFLYELFAQYIQTGEVRLKPLPQSLSYGRKAWGRPTRYMALKPQYRDNDHARALATQKLSQGLAEVFDRVLADAVGRIYVM